MSFVILGKELRALRMYIMLVIGYVMLDFGYTCVTEFPDMHVLVASNHMHEARSEIIGFGVIFGAIVGAFALGQEREHETQRFLDGLPVSRWHIFLLKFIAASLVVMLWPLCHLALHVGMGLISQNSVSQPISWSYVGAMFGCSSLLMICILGVALALSFLRQWFALGAGIAVWLVVWLRLQNIGWTRWLNTPEMLTFGLKQGVVTAIPWKPIAAHAVLAAVAVLIAACGYAWRDGWWSRLLQRLGQWRFIAWLRVLAPLGAVAVWFSLLIHFSQDSPPQDKADRTRAAAGSAPAATASTKDKDKNKAKAKTSSFDGFDSIQTRHYEFLFRNSQRNDVLNKIANVESIHDEAAAFFGNPNPPGDRIIVDLASLVSSHAAGQTNWTKIRVPLQPGQTTGQFREILRHETAHVYIEQLSDGAATSHFNSLRAFHEGAATAAEVSVNDPEATHSRQEMERWAALAHSRGNVPLSLLCNDKGLSHERDTFLVYPLGYVFIKALIRAGGETLPRRLMETLRDSPPAPGANGEALWQHLTQHCNVAWEQVLALYQDELATLAKREHGSITPLPRLHPTVKIEPTEFIIQPGLEETAVPARLTCRIEKDLGLITEPTTVPLSPDGNFHLSRSLYPGTTLRYMIGWQLPHTLASAFEPWQEITVK